MEIRGRSEIDGLWMGTEVCFKIEKRVVIVGGGPVGLALSLILAKYEVPSLILEARESPTPKDESRAIAWMPRALELIDWLHLRDDFLSVGVTRTSHEFWSSGKRLLDLSFDKMKSPFRYSLQLPQHDTERILEKAALETGIVEIRRSHRVVQAIEMDNRAIMLLDSPEGPYTIKAAWAVACDGARSKVRETLGIKTVWRDYGMDSAVADFEMDCDLPKEISKIVLDPKRPYGFFYFSPGKWRFIYRLNEGEDRKLITSEKAAKELLLSKLPTAFIHRFLWASAFRLGQGQSESYRKGRWLLAGDAAHAMGPSAGAGMMIGVLGAWRLGWRLALAAKGHPQSELLLQDYENEQRAAAEEIQNTNAIIFKNMAISNPILSNLRSFGLSTISKVSAITHNMTVKEALIKQTLPVSDAYDHQVLGSWKYLQHFDKWKQGERVPYLNEQETNLLDRIKLSHVIVSIGKSDEEQERKYAEKIRNIYPLPIANQLVLPDKDSNLRKRNSKQIVFAIVRPDQHVVSLLTES